MKSFLSHLISFFMRLLDWCELTLQLQMWQQTDSCIRVNLSVAFDLDSLVGSSPALVAASGVCVCLYARSSICHLGLSSAVENRRVTSVIPELARRALDGSR